MGKFERFHALTILRRDWEGLRRASRNFLRASRRKPLTIINSYATNFAFLGKARIMNYTKLYEIISK